MLEVQAVEAGLTALRERQRGGIAPNLWAWTRYLVVSEIPHREQTLSAVLCFFHAVWVKAFVAPSLMHAKLRVHH